MHTIAREKLYYLLFSLILLASCGGGSSGSSTTSSSNSSSSSSISSTISSDSNSSASSTPGSSANISIDTETRYQTVAGFGGAVPMWNVVTSALTAAEVRKLVGTGDDELGMTILRTIVDPDSNSWPRAAASLLEAKTYANGVQILASPWSPPAHMKDNQSTVNGGKLLVEYYEDYANHLNAYLEYMSSQGVSIDVMSIQNEPDWHPSYESCDWSGEELRNFVRDFGNLIQAKVMVGESLRFDRDYTDPSLNDEAALDNFEIVGGHLYSAETSGTFEPYPLAEEKGKERWMTEWNYHEADGDGAAIWGGENLAVWDETLDVVLASVHKSMDVNWNAYIWWWSLRFYSFLGDGDSNFGTQRGEILKRGWAFSHYSKFVRPGYTRIFTEVQGDLDSIFITAYTGDNKIVAVILNRSSNSHENFTIEVPTAFEHAEAYITSQTQNREPLAVTADGNTTTLSSLDARSIVTLVLTL